MMMRVIALNPQAQSQSGMGRALHFDPSVKVATLVVGLAAVDLMVECRDNQLWIAPITERHRRRIERLRLHLMGGRHV